MMSPATALITGGSRGIGKAIAMEMARRRYRVAINCQSRTEDATALRDQLRASGAMAEVFQADVSDQAQVQRMFTDAQRTLGPVEVLVNNAGITRDQLLLMMTEPNWKRVLEVNLNGVYNCCRGVIRFMYGRKKGIIINIGSGSGLSPRAGQTNYSATKSALIGFTRSLAREAAPFGVRAVVVAPGFTRTELADSISNTAIQDSLGMIPLGRWGNPEEIAAVVGYVASDDAAYITGVTLTVDGGRAAGEQDFGLLAVDHDS